MLIVRENTECLYVKQEWLENDGNTAVAQRIIARATPPSAFRAAPLSPPPIAHTTRAQAAGRPV